MYYAATTRKSVVSAVEDLEAAVRKRGYGVLHAYDLRETLAGKGVQLNEDARVLDVCNPQRAGEVLRSDMNLSVALPCRIAVYRDGSLTKIGMIRPSPLLAMLSTEKGLAAIAADVESTLKAAIDEAAATTAGARP